MEDALGLDSGSRGKWKYLRLSMRATTWRPGDPSWPTAGTLYSKGGKRGGSQGPAHDALTTTDRIDADVTNKYLALPFFCSPCCACSPSPSCPWALPFGLVDLLISDIWRISSNPS